MLDMKTASSTNAAKKADDAAKSEALRNASLGMLTPGDRALIRQSKRTGARTKQRSNQSGSEEEDNIIIEGTGGSRSSSSRKASSRSSKTMSDNDDSPASEIDNLEGSCVTMHRLKRQHNNAVELQEARKKQKLEMKSQREDREFQFRKEQAELDRAFKMDQAEKDNEFRKMQLNFQLEMMRLLQARPGAPAQNDQQGEEEPGHENNKSALDCPS